MITAEDIKKKALTEQVSVSLIFKELVQVTVLDYLFKKGLTADFVFQGGTAIRLLYQGVRYSEDMDFVLRKENAAGFKNLGAELKALPAHIRKFIPFVNRAQLKVQKETDRFKRYCIILETDFLGAKDKMNIEAANIPSRQSRTIIFRHPFLTSAPALTAESPEEILSDKLIAFAARDYIKGRDVWDTHFLLRTLNVAVNHEVILMVRKKISDYGLAEDEFLNSFRKRLEKFKTGGVSLLHSEMDRFLPLGYREMFQPKYADICEDLLGVLSRLPDEMKNDH